jgi:phosphoribosylformylglycinamidine synthase
MATPRVLVLRAPGVNCDEETQFAFERAGAIAERTHINRVREQPALLERYQILVVPGGFSYGDDLGAGKVLGLQLSRFLGPNLQKFRDQEKLILGICNGFQAILQAGLVVSPDEDGPLVTLTQNTSGRYEDRWVHLQVDSERSPFLTGGDRFYVPVAHAEGRIVFRKEWIRLGLQQAGQVVLRYVDEQGESGPFPVNPNGSEGDVAGMCDASGRVMGLMPHPERHILPTQHPRWTRAGLAPEGDGMMIFRNAVNYFIT